MRTDFDYALCNRENIATFPSVFLVLLICVAMLGIGYGVMNEHETTFQISFVMLAVFGVYWYKTGVCNFFLKLLIIIFFVLTLFVPPLGIVTYVLWRNRKLDWLITG